jgi:protein-disulfide isomerase
MYKIWFALVGLLTLTLVPPVSGEAADPRLVPAGAETALNITTDDRILGNPNAPNTIIEYASLTCPHCAHFENDVLPELKKKWIDTGKAKLVLRDFPLDEPALRDDRALCTTR